MPDFHFIHPGDLATRTGGYRYARELLAALARRGITAGVHRLSDRFPFPDVPALAQAAEVLDRIPDGSVVVLDGLALGAMPAQVAGHAGRLALIGLVHHPLALERGLSEDESSQLAASERQALAFARAVVVTSPATAAALLQDYGVPADRITVVLPGTDQRKAGSAPGGTAPSAPGPVRLLCVASITPRKGHLDLVEALAAFRGRNPQLDWRLLCVGSLERDPACAADLVDRTRVLGLEGLVSLAGERDEAAVDEAYADADVFVLASHHEGYGMVLAEALAHGLPIVSTTAGAIPETVPAGAGLLVAPGDVEALAAALTAVVGDPSRRQAMAAVARREALALPDWEAAAEGFAGVLASVLERVGSDDHPDPLSFSADWLALREPHDHAARADMLTGELRRFLAGESNKTVAGAIRVLDLACGSGSSLRYLAPRLGGSQHWIMVDRDPALLALPAQSALPQVTIEPICLDLVEGLAALPLAGVDLITASALLDLVSGDWLDRLLTAVRSRGRRSPSPGMPALLFALNYDGQVTWEPPLPDDARAVALFDRHQRGDKGFGPALGPAAAAEAVQRLQAAGYAVTHASSAWRLDREDREIQREFIVGLAQAAREVEAGDLVAMGPCAVSTVATAAAPPSAPCAATADQGDWLDTWLEKRLAWVDAGRSTVVVGHRDVLALPASPSR